MTHKRAANYGKGVVNLAHQEPQLVDVQTVKVRLLETFRAPNYKPPVLPAVATELLALSRKPDVGFKEITQTVERDPLIAANVLKLAQSPAYATRVAPSTLLDAVQRLGLLTVRDMVFQIVVGMKVFRAPGYEQLMESLRKHCILTAHITRVICQQTALSGEHAFLCGLLHDVGYGGTLLSLGSLPVKQRPPLVAVMGALSEVHAEAGAMMAKMWQLAPEIQLVLQHHHDFDPKKLPHPIVAALTFAEVLAEQHGAALKVPANGNDHELRLVLETLDRTHPERVEGALKMLGLSAAQRTQIEREAERIAPTVLG